MPRPFTRTPHLVALVAETEHLATRLAATDPGQARADLWRDAALASLRLDGSTIPAAPTPEQLAAATGGPVLVTAPSRGSWDITLRSALDTGTIEDDATDAVVWAREYRGVIDGLAADDLASRLWIDPVDMLADLHRRLTAGLVHPDVAGRPRTTEQAVHDGSVGRILWYTPAPADVPGELHRLGGWLASAAAREHALVVSGIVHFEILRIHPFEAANGRLARTAARLALRARGLDPHGLAVAEIALADDPLGIHEEVARTTRRQDLTIWLERWGEAVTAGLRHAAASLGLPGPDVPDRADRILTGRDDLFTVLDYRADAGVGPEDARADLATLLDAGRIARVPGSRGLRFRLVR